MRRTAMSLAVLGLTFASPLAAQPRQDPASMVAAQRQAMAPLARMDGVWRGPAWSITPAGRHDITQTERIGTYLGGSVRVIEGRGYNADGTVGFNALGVVSFDPATNSYTISSWALGHNGVFPFRVTADGYAWEVPAGALLEAPLSLRLNRRMAVVGETTGWRRAVAPGEHRYHRPPA